MTVVAVREYESIRVGDTCDASSQTVTKAQGAFLERFNEAQQRRFKARPFQYGPRGSLVAQNYVGIIDLGNDQVEVLPKIDAPATDVRRSLAKMLCVALDVDVLGEGGTSVNEADSILEVLVRLFCAHLWTALHKGMVRRYEAKSDTLTVLRGRVDFTQQLRQNICRPDRLACNFDEFTEDTALNQVLKAALRLLIRVAKRPANQRSLAELLFCMEDVADVPIGALRWHQAVADRLSARYRPLLEMAKLFLSGTSPDVLTGQRAGFALMFDMNVLFEEYVGRLLQRTFARSGMAVRRQGPFRHVARRNDGMPAFLLKPDVAAQHGEDIRWIVDTKWKRLDLDRTRDGVSSGDMYQMVVYARQYRAPHVMLLYPHHVELGDNPGLRDSYLLEPSGIEGEVRKISVGTLDLRNLGTVPAQLEEMLKPLPSPGSPRS